MGGSCCGCSWLSWEEEALGGTGRCGRRGRWERKWRRPMKEPRRKKAAKRGSGRRVKKRKGCGRLVVPAWWCLGEEAEELWRSGEEGGEEDAKGCWCRSRWCDLAGECGRRIDAIKFSTQSRYFRESKNLGCGERPTEGRG